jgi:hypothetical protein
MCNDMHLSLSSYSSVGRHIMLVTDSVKKAAQGWQNNPGEMVKDIAVSFIAGQGIYWVLGYDQFGFFMNPVKQVGRGDAIAGKVAARLPKTAVVAWVAKATEILSDALRIKLEGEAYRRHGVTPDFVATAVSSPLWQMLEVSEKTMGAILHPERVTTPEGVKLSLACIYGNLFRYTLDAAYSYQGDKIKYVVGRGLDSVLRFPARRR